MSTVYLGECHRKKHNNDPKQIKRLLRPSIKSFSHNKTQRVSNLFFGKVQTAQVTSNYIILIEHQSKGPINSSKQSNNNAMQRSAMLLLGKSQQKTRFDQHVQTKGCAGVHMAQSRSNNTIPALIEQSFQPVIFLLLFSDSKVYSQTIQCEYTM